MSDHSDVSQQQTRALRDGWLKSYSEYAKIGKTYSSNGAVLFEGLSPFEWLQELKVTDPHKHSYQLSPPELRAIWVKLAEKYNTAASFHANLTLAAAALEDELDQVEGKFIQTELAKYSSGGEYWDDTARKSTQRRPGADILQKMAKQAAAESYRALGMLRREVRFFKNCMDNLEYQRRCFKDFAELLALDPATRGLA